MICFCPKPVDKIVLRPAKDYVHSGLEDVSVGAVRLGLRELYDTVEVGFAMRNLFSSYQSWIERHYLQIEFAAVPYAK